jgi:hypothetical protein
MVSPGRSDGSVGPGARSVRFSGVDRIPRLAMNGGYPSSRLAGRRRAVARTAGSDSTSSRCITSGAGGEPTRLNVVADEVQLVMRVRGLRYSRAWSIGGLAGNKQNFVVSTGRWGERLVSGETAARTVRGLCRTDSAREEPMRILPRAARSSYTSKDGVGRNRSSPDALGRSPVIASRHSADCTGGPPSRGATS